MKKKNVRVGMKVQIKDGAWTIGDEKVGDVLTVDELDSNGTGFWTKESHYYTFKEVRKVKGHAYL